MIYHLNLRRRDRHVRDEEGSDHPDVDAARGEAIVAARELMAEAILNGDDISDSVFEIVEEASRVLVEVPFVDAIRRRA